jgi:hypothetical protein
VRGLLATALSASQWLHVRAFEAATERPEHAQARLLAELLRGNARTAFGREHGFARITTPAGYARRVPIRDYEGVRPYVKRLLAGERRVLTAEPPLSFAATSGTTGEPKLVPVTARSAASMAALMRLWTCHALAAHPTLLDHRLLTVVGPAVEGVTACGLPVGAMTGMSYQRLPWLVRRRHALPYAVALIGDHESRYFVTLRLALAQAISSIGTPNPSTLLRLADVAGRRSEALVRAIHDGTLGVGGLEPIAHAGLDAPGLRAALTEGLRADPARAATLTSLAARRGHLVLGECWPELALIGCWLGGSAGLQARHLAEHFGPAVAHRDLGLIASEGRLTVPLEDHSAAGVLAVRTTFFEFVPEDAIEATAPPTLLAHELEEGRRYYVIITGANGLYRYDLNDVVEVRGFHHRTPRVAFVRKGRDMLSITGEKLHLNHVLHAMTAAGHATGLDVWQFRLIADAERSRYDVLVELSSPAGADRLRELATRFDRALAAVNVEYAGKRASGRLAPPRLHRMRPGWSERVCRQEFARGRRDVQHKWSVLQEAWDEASRTEVVEGVDVSEAARCAS